MKTLTFINFLVSWYGVNFSLERNLVTFLTVLLVTHPFRWYSSLIFNLCNFLHWTLFVSVFLVSSRLCDLCSPSILVICLFLIFIKILCLCCSSFLEKSLVISQFWLPRYLHQFLIFLALDFQQRIHVHQQQSDSIFFVHPIEGPNSATTSHKLSWSNYLTWSRYMQHVLSAKDKLAFISGSTPIPYHHDLNKGMWERCNRLIHSWFDWFSFWTYYTNCYFSRYYHWCLGRF